MALGSNVLPWYLHYIDEIEFRLKDNGQELTHAGRELLLDMLHRQPTPNVLIRLFTEVTLTQPIQD